MILTDQVTRKFSRIERQRLLLKFFPLSKHLFATRNLNGCNLKVKYLEELIYLHIKITHKYLKYKVLQKNFIFYENEIFILTLIISVGVNIWTNLILS